MTAKFKKYTILNWFCLTTIDSVLEPSKYKCITVITGLIL